MSAHHGQQVTTLELSTMLQSNNTLMLRELILAHGGIGYLPHWLIADELRAGQLVQLLPDYRLNAIALHAVYLDRRHLSAKIRSFIDFMVEKAQEARFQMRAARGQGQQERGRTLLRKARGG